MSVIIDLSHHQLPSKINYDKLAKEVSFVIIRTQYGSNTIDRHYKTHHQEFQKRGVPTAAYAWVRGVNIKDMEIEATNFYNRTKDLKPTFWFLDVEEKSMNNMREGVSAYVKKLRSLGAKKVGIYIAHHLYQSFNLNLSEVDAIWIPRYGNNDGRLNRSNRPSYYCDIWQYTSKGRLNGYSGDLDLNALNGNKELSYFTSGQENEKEKEAEVPVRGDAKIKAVQKTLNTRYKTKVTVDGLYGKDTEKALNIGLQIEINNLYKKRLAVDGIIGSKTKAAFSSVLQKKGANNRLVYIIQAKLHMLGYNTNGIEGIFGNITEQAVKQFQKASRIKQDGIVGKDTLTKLFS